MAVSPDLTATPSPPARGRLRRDPKRGRVWYRLPRKPVPDAIDRDELARRLYTAGGPREGLRQRRDVIEKRALLYAYLCRRSRGERTGRWAGATSEVIYGLMPAMSELDAKPWDPTTIRGGKDELLYHYATIVARLLDDLAAIGLVRWGGARDNNGLWWRLEIELLDDPWRWQPVSRSDGPEDVSAQPPGETLPSAREDGAERPPPRSPQTPGEVSFTSNSEEPFGASGYAGAQTAVDFATSLTGPNLSLPSPGACATTSQRPSGPGGYPLPVTKDPGPDFAASLEAAISRATAWENAQEPPSPQPTVLVEQVAARVEQLRAAPPGTAVIAWRLEEAFVQANGGAPALFRRAAHLPRLRRAVARYERYGDCRPKRWPAGGVAAVVHQVERDDTAYSLAGVVRSIDTLTKRMRREHKRRHESWYLDRARRRALGRQRRRQQVAAGNASWRRPDRSRLASATISQLHESLMAACQVDPTNRADAQARMLDRLGGLATPEQLRRELRDRYLLAAGHDGRYGGWRCDPLEFHSIHLYGFRRRRPKLEETPPGRARGGVARDVQLRPAAC